MACIVFCSDPRDPRVVDELYAGEYAAAREFGLACSLVDFEALVNDSDPARAVRRVVNLGHEESGVYRGWMLTVEDYAALYAALVARGIRLVNSPAQYRHCHHLPESYTALAGHTPRTEWIACLPPVDMEAVRRAVGPFGNGPIIIKDYVKSQKHYWDEACFVPSASDHKALERVVSRFVELQAGHLQGGLVFREYVELQMVGDHPKSGMPLSKEYRIFFFDGRAALVINYWREIEYGPIDTPIESFGNLAARIDSRFFTMDVAELKSGGWIVIELGDGQVAGLPDGVDPRELLAVFAGEG